MQDLNVRSTALAAARRTLDDACKDLDDVVGTLAEVDAQTAVATDELVALLIRVVTARRHLNLVEREAPSHGPRTSLR